MKVVGVDFGTANIRVATWDSSQPDIPPRPCLIGQGDATTMPAVIGFQKRRGRGFSTILGEDADNLGDSADTVVVRNIKRWALANDPFVFWNLGSRKTPQPPWWNQEARCVEVWGEQIPVQKVMYEILAEAFRRADLSGDFVWRAGCPVHAGLDYRSELARTLSEFGGDNNVSSVIDEPILFLALAQTVGSLSPGGSYMVFDLGGGSFDCALSEVDSEGRTVVYASHGDPLLGGSEIDRLLKEQLSYVGSDSLLRIAKEQLSPSNLTQPVDAGLSLSWADVENVLRKSRFVERTRLPMRETYISGKVIWKREEGASPIGSIPGCRLEMLPGAFKKDLNGIILLGGPTKSPFIRERLSEIFGADMVIPAERLVPQDVPDPELTGLSLGACYSSEDHSNPLYVRRLPVRVTLQHLPTGDKVEYEPYQHFAYNFSPAKSFESDCLPTRAQADTEYVLSIEEADGTLLERRRIDFGKGGVSQSPVRSPRLVIDTFGRIGIANNKAGKPWVEIENPPWQTARQKNLLQDLFDRQRDYRLTEGARVHDMITENPFGWQAGHG